MDKSFCFMALFRKNKRKCRQVASFLKGGGKRLIRNIDERKNPDNLQNPLEEGGKDSAKVGFFNMLSKNGKNLGGTTASIFNFLYDII